MTKALLPCSGKLFSSKLWLIIEYKYETNNHSPLTLYTKTIQEYVPQCRRLNHKAAKDGLEHWLHVFDMGKDFLNRTQKTLIIKNSSSPRWEKRLDTDWSQIFTNIQQSTIPRYTKNASNSVNNNKKIQTTHVKTWSTDLNRFFSKKLSPKANRPVCDLTL